MSNENRGFRGIWIPAHIWLDERLGSLDKIILAEIDSLDNDEKGCFATNKSLADFCKCSERKIAESISLLKSIGYLYEESFDGRQRVLRSRVAKSARDCSKICDPTSQNLRPYNIIDNITDNNIYPTPEASQKKTDYQKFADTYNSICTNLPKVKIMTESRKTAVKAYLKMLTPDSFEDVCQKTNRSSFLCGKNGQSWKADFDFIIKVKNAVKILEGSYSDAPAASELPKWN